MAYTALQAEDLASAVARALDMTPTRSIGAARPVATGTGTFAPASDLPRWEWAADDVRSAARFGGIGMASKHRLPEEIVAELRQVEVLMGQGKVVAEAIRSIDVLADLLITRGVPGHIRSDNGPDAAAAVKGWITGVRQRGYVQGFNGKLRDELPSCEAFSC